jgi:hypothetical protein
MATTDHSVVEGPHAERPIGLLLRSASHGVSARYKTALAFQIRLVGSRRAAHLEAIPHGLARQAAWRETCNVAAENVNILSFRKSAP